MPFGEGDFEKPKIGAEIGQEEEKPAEGQPGEEMAEQPGEPEGAAEKSAEKKELTEAEIEARREERNRKLDDLKGEIAKTVGFSLSKFNQLVADFMGPGARRTFSPELNVILEKISAKQQEICEESAKAFAELKRRRKEDIAKKLEAI